MEIIEITGFKTGLDDSGVNFLDPADSFETLKNAYIYRQVLQSRLGFSQFGNRISDNTRIMGIFKNILPDGTLETLVCSTQYLYTYNNSTNQFDQIPFNARILALDPAFNFGIVSKEDYVSGTTYLKYDGSQRFVFTGKGMSIAPLTPGDNQSAVFFYDGTSIGDFFSNADNPTPQPVPINPDPLKEPASSIGDMVRATKVIFFGERLNFIVPQTTVTTYQQGVLFSGIRDASASGDRFNVPGSGLLNFDTSAIMKGGLILGDILIANFQDSNWSLEKTRDAFNPYFPRKIPSVIGTDAGFSAVQWNYECKSLGKTGGITTDGRSSLRFDNKVWFFTADNIDQENFELCYGGFDRVTGQFLFAFRSNFSTLSSVTQDQILVYNYEESTWAVYDQRFSVFGECFDGINLTWDDIDETQNPSWATWDETEELWDKIGIGAATQKTLAGDDLGFIYHINQDFDDYFVDVTNITQASSAVVTVDPSAFQVGDEIVFQNVVGMTEINEMVATVLSASTTSLTVNIDSRNFTGYGSGGTVSKLIDFEVESIPLNPWRDQGLMINISHVEFLIDANAGDLYVDFYIDEEESPFKTAFIESPTTTTKKKVWVVVEVNQEANFITFVMRNKSYSAQTRITSIRIHCEPGSFTNQ